jgi:hypothetical protein
MMVLSTSWTTQSTGIKAYWNFNDGSGTRLNNTYNVTIHNGTLQNMPSSAWTTGLLGGGLIFNGSNQWVGNITKPTNITNLANNYSLSLWFKPTENLYEGIISQYTTGTSAGEFIIAKQATGKVVFFRKIGTTDSTANSVTSTSSISLNSWNHVVIQSYSNGTIKIYFNGTLEDEIESLDGAGTNWDAGMLIGMGSSWITRFNGTIDEVGIWDRILTSSEISDLYNNGVGIAYSATTTPTISVTLDSPIDSLISSLNILKFNSSSIMVAGNFTNATLRIYNTTTSIFGTNFTTINGTSNSTSLSFSSLVPGSYIWNVEYCGNATTTIVCNSATNNRTFTISSFTENSQIYNVNTSETSIETFSINITYNSTTYSLGTGILNYNGTDYLGVSTVVGNNAIFSKSISVPSFSTNQTVKFNWRFSFTGLSGSFTTNATTMNQTIIPINASVYNSPYKITFINFTVYDEKALTLLNSTFSSTFNYGINATSKILSYQDTSLGNSTFGFAFNQSYLSYLITGNLEYSSPGYITRLYTLPQQTITNTTTQINLYLLNSSTSTSFIVKVRDSTYSSVPNAVVHIQRYYAGINTWLTTEIVTTNGEGKALGHFTTEDVSYRFLVYVDGILSLTSTPTKIFCETTPCTITLTIPTGSAGFILYGNLSSFDYTLSYSKTTEDFTYSYIDTATDSLGGRLKVIWSSLGNATETTVCDSVSSLSTDILTCDLTGHINGTYIAFAYNNRTSTGSTLVNTLIISKVRNIVANVGVDGIIWTVFFIMGIVMLGLFKPVMAVAFAVFGLIMVSLLGLISIPAIGLISIILLAIIILWGMRTV